MNIFFDTNILLDVALRREPHGATSEAVLKDAIENHSCFMSWHTVSNLSYILEKLEGRETAIQFIRNIASVCRIREDDDASDRQGGGFGSRSRLLLL